MRLVITACLLALAGCGGGGGDGDADSNHTVSPYYPDDAPHLLCDDSDGLPCCDPPVGELQCPEGTTLDMMESASSLQVRCDAPGHVLRVSLAVKPDGAVATHGELRDGGYAEVCDQETGKVLKRTRLGVMADDTDNCVEYCAPGQQCSVAPCQ